MIDPALPDHVGDADQPSGLHTRHAVGGEPVSPPTMTLLASGLALVALGFILLGLAWGLVAGALTVADQIPYLVSAGLTGLGLIIVGATVLNIHAKRQEAAHHDRTQQQLLQVLRTLASRQGHPDTRGD